MSTYAGARIQITTREGTYEGTFHSVDPVTKLISIEKAKALPSGQKFLGLLNFYGNEIDDLKVVQENDLPSSGLEPEDKSAIQERVEEKVTEKKRSNFKPAGFDEQEAEEEEVFDDYVYQQDCSTNSAWHDHPVPSFSEEVTIPQEETGIIQNCPESENYGAAVEDVQQGVNRMRLNDNSLDHGQPTEYSGRENRGGNQQANYTLITQHDATFNQAVDDMQAQTAIGLVLKGSRLGRRGKLSLVLVLCEDRVYMFDALALPTLFTKSFIAILESTSIAKIIHDCRFISDLLYHQYGILLNSVCDTQVGDILIRKRQYMGDFPRHVCGMTQCLLEYLDINIQDIAMHHENTEKISENEARWLERPLSPIAVRCALLDTVYLLRLQEAIHEQLMAEFTCAIDIYLATERDKLEVDPKKISARAAFVPRELTTNLHQRVQQYGITGQQNMPKMNDTSKLPRAPDPAGEGVGGGEYRGRGRGRGRGSVVPEGGAHSQHQMIACGTEARKTNAPVEKANFTPPRQSQMANKGLTARPIRQHPPRQPLTLNINTQEDDHDEEVGSSDGSHDPDDEPFADVRDHHLWQHRYAKTQVKAVTLREALAAKEERERIAEGEILGSVVPDQHRHGYDQRLYPHVEEKHRNKEQEQSPPRVDHAHAKSGMGSEGGDDLLGPMENAKVSQGQDQVVGQSRAQKASSNHSDCSELDRGLDGLSVRAERSGGSPEELCPSRTAPVKLRQPYTMPNTLANMKHSDPTLKDTTQTGASQPLPDQTHLPLPSQSSYADALSGRKKTEKEIKLGAKRGLKAIGRALASGQIFNKDEDDDDSDDNSDTISENVSDSKSDKTRYPSQHEQGPTSRPAFSPGPEQRSPVRGGVDGRGSPAMMGRGRASLIKHHTRVISERPAHQPFQNRTHRGRGRGLSVQVDFPSMEEMDSAPDSLPIAPGSAFLSQRAI